MEPPARIAGEAATIELPTLTDSGTDLLEWPPQEQNKVTKSKQRMTLIGYRKVKAWCKDYSGPKEPIDYLMKGNIGLSTCDSFIATSIF